MSTDTRNDGGPAATVPMEAPQPIEDALSVALKCHGEFGSTYGANEHGARRAAQDVWRVLREAGLFAARSSEEAAPCFGAGYGAAYEAIVTADGPYKGYTPAEDPAELLTDMYGDVLGLRDALKQIIAKDRNGPTLYEQRADGCYQAVGNAEGELAEIARAVLAARSSKEA